MIALSVNLNKIALIRNSRSGNSPDIIEQAKVCIQSGANGITVHPRPDQRHIRPKDIEDLHELLKKYPDIEFNIEGNPFAQAKPSIHESYPGLLSLVEQCLPTQCTLVPDSDSQLTSDHGFNLKQDGERLKPILKKLKSLGVRSSLFMDPDLEQISLAAEIGTDRIELYTGPYAEAYADDSLSLATKNLFEQHTLAAEHAHKLGLGVNAGHDLNLHNLKQYKQLPYLQEASIGHALIIDALQIGLEKTVVAYKKALVS